MKLVKFRVATENGDTFDGEFDIERSFLGKLLDSFDPWSNFYNITWKDNTKSKKIKVRTSSILYIEEL